TTHPGSLNLRQVTPVARPVSPFGPPPCLEKAARFLETGPPDQNRIWGATAKRKLTMKTKLALMMLLAAAAMPSLAQAADIDWSKVDAAIGKSAVVSGDVHRYGLPRSDLKV